MARRATQMISAAAMALVLAGGCSQGQVPDQAPPPAADLSALTFETVAEGLEFPWSLAFLPNGDMLVSERAGRMRVIRDGALVDAPVSGLPEILVLRQGGLFDVAPHPNFAENGLIYFAYASGTEDANHTTLARGRFDGAALSNVEVLFSATPTKRGGFHFGGRLLFAPDGTLFLTLGDGGGYRDQAQDVGDDFGALIRLTWDGEVPADNPFVGEANARPEIYSYGHRNVQGIARDPDSGRIYTHEHGPRGGDEVNVIVPGSNYGWPAITYGIDYSGAVISPDTAREGMEQPLVYWVPSIAPSGLVFYTGAMFPQWRGDLFTSALAGQEIRRVDLDASGAVLGQESLFQDLGVRFRDVRQGPDGALYLLTDEPEGRVLRVRAAG